MKKKAYIWMAIVAFVILFFIFNIIQSTPYFDDLDSDEQKEIFLLAKSITANEEGDMNKLLAILEWQNTTLSLELPEGYATRKANHSVLGIITQGYGWCYDRSYVFEILAQSLGFKVRHVALASKDSTHALSEVYVDDKWVLFETSKHKIYRNENGTPLGVVELHHRRDLIEEDSKAVYEQFVYGVNSFHGKFAQPKIPYPDMAVRQLHYNLGIIPYLPYNFWKVRVVLIAFGIVLVVAGLVFTGYQFHRKSSSKPSRKKK